MVTSQYTWALTVPRSGVAHHIVAAMVKTYHFRAFDGTRVTLIGSQDFRSQIPFLLIYIWRRLAWVTNYKVQWDDYPREDIDDSTPTLVRYSHYKMVPFNYDQLCSNTQRRKGSFVSIIHLLLGIGWDTVERN